MFKHIMEEEIPYVQYKVLKPFVVSPTNNQHTNNCLQL